MKALVWLKSFGVPGFMAAFFLGYFLILNHPFFGVTVMPLTAVDRLISYQTSAWPLYVSLWVYVQLPLALIDNRRELVLYGWIAGGLSLIGFGVFILWPTAVPAIPEGAGGSSFLSIRSLDTTGNSCPSLHVAFAVFTALWLERLLRKARLSAALSAFNVLWCLGIVYSTLATKQHVMLDVYAGAALGCFGAAVQAQQERRQCVQVPLSPSPELAQSIPEARKL